MRSRRLLKTWSLLGLLAWGLALPGCGNDSSPTFARIENVVETIADFRRFQLQGQERLEYQTTVKPGLLHVEFLMNWTNLTRDIEVDVYVVRNEDYVATVPPAQLGKVFWTSVPQEGPQFGDRRPTLIHLHPSPGDWVIVFFNPKAAGNPANRATLSATVQLSYFK